MLDAVASLAAALSTSHATASGQLAKVAHLVRVSPLRTTTSVTITTLGGKVVFDWSGAVRRVPASNEKLLTAVGALDILHPAGVRTTTVRSVVAPTAEGVVNGSVYLVGDGDPTLTTTRLKALAASIAAAGVKRIVGDVVGDGSRFDRVRAAPGWKAGFSPDECAPLSALAIDRDFRTHAVWNPELDAATRLKAALVKDGVKVDGSVTLGPAPPAATPLVSLASPTVARLLRALGKDSDNFTAEMLAKDVATASGAGTTARGMARIVAAIARRGISASGVVAADGSGLSSRDRVTTRFLAKLLGKALADARIGPSLDAALSIAGVDGTLVDRMRTGPAHRRARAKTGTLDGSSALTGHVGGYVFSIITNSRLVDQQRAHDLQDAIVQLLAAVPISASRPTSSSTATPSLVAFSSFEPAASPASR
jgi:D-alanyl-D-alanine carboxypeptidase/D-alanyl-D-alanine-endopeptidase (penicillin-binding protein 4)